MDKPIVSIIMPTYNYGLFITKSVEELQVQTYPHWECIIIDDGSTDDTKAIIDNLTKSDDRFIYFYQENQGVSAARNLGISKAKGEFIQFLDADDYLASDKLEKNIDMVLQRQLDFVYSDECWFTQGGEYRKIKQPFLADDYQARVMQLISSNPFAINNPLFSIKLLEKTKKFNTKVDVGEDWLFWFEIIYHNAKAGKCDDTLAYIQVHNTHKKQRKYLQSQIRVRNLISQYNINDNLKYLNRKKKYWYMIDYANKNYLIHLSLFYTFQYFIFAFPRTWFDFKIFMGDILFSKIRRLI